MTSIKDIAKQAGVSPITVSRVLNGSSQVKEDKRQRVLEAIRNSDYKPNPIARRLKKKEYRAKAVGVSFPIVVHPFYFEILKGIYACLTQHDYSLIIYNIGINRDQVFEMVLSDNLSGFLIVSNPLTKKEKDLLSVNKVDFIYLNHYEENENSIYINNKMGGLLAASYLVEKGARKIGYVGELLKSFEQMERYRSFKGELERNQMSLKIERYIKLNEDESYLITKDIINNTDLDGIFYYCDELAYGGIKARKELKKDFLIVGYDDLPSSRYAGLTTVRQPAYFMGYEGASQILGLMNKSDKASRGIINKCLEPDIVIRE